MLYIQDKESKKNNSSDQEFDIFLFFKFLLRNKFLIGKFSLISFLLGIIFSFTIKNVYEGQFQIVLKKDEQQASAYGSFQNIIGLDKTNDLKTEVGILESPSLLKPILKYILLSKDSEDISNLDAKFFSWRKNNLDVNLLKGTSILDISYRDEDKDLIIPVLQKMTLAYQDYSGRTKRRREELTKTFLINQIDKYQKKSSASLKAAQDFAIDEDLVFNNLNIDENSNLIQNNSLSTTNLLQTNIGFERDRVKAANQLKKIDLQIEKIKNLKDEVDELIYYGASIPALAKEGLPDEIKESENRLLTINQQLESIKSLNENDLEALQYIGASIPALVEQGLPQTLKNIESNLVDLRAKYTDADINIINLIEKRKLTSSLLRERAIKYLNVEKTNIFLNREPRINLLKDRAIKYLKALRLEIEADMEAVMRPKEVILKYKELIREAARDEKTLISLEQQLRIIELEGAKTEDPWELITEPTLKNKPVEPSRIFISFSFLVLGTLLGVIFSIYKRRDRKSVV